MDAIKTIADAIRAERKAAEEETAGTGKAAAEDIKEAVTAGQEEPEKDPDKESDKEPDKEPDKDDKKEE